MTRVLVRSRPERMLVYYFAFPHYRADILNALLDQAGDRVLLASGSVGRGGIRFLTPESLPGLQMHHTLRLGPFTLEPRIVRMALRRDMGVVIVAPAVSSLTTWIIVMSRRILGRRTFLWGQSGKAGDRSAKRYVQEVMNRAASGLLLYGRLEEQGALSLGLSTSKIHRVYNAVAGEEAPVDEDELHRRVRGRAVRARDEGVLRLVYLGRVNADKRLDVLLDAARLLVDDFPHLEVDIVGDGDDVDRLRSLVGDLPIRLSPATYDPAGIVELLSGATLVVSPWIMGLLAVDALRAGTPVLVPDNPLNGSEVDALAPDITAFGFIAGDAQDLVRAVHRALEVLPSVPREDYVRTRAEGLAAWSAPAVATRILSAIHADLARRSAA